MISLVYLVGAAGVATCSASPKQERKRRKHTCPAFYSLGSETNPPPPPARVLSSLLCPFHPRRLNSLPWSLSEQILYDNMMTARVIDVILCLCELFTIYLR